MGDDTKTVMYFTGGRIGTYSIFRYIKMAAVTKYRYKQNRNEHRYETYFGVVRKWYG